MITVYVTCRDKPEARKIARHLLSMKLIACANLFPAEGMYKWKGRIADEKEVVMLCKAVKKNFKKIEKEIKKLHSYAVPCIVAFEWAASSKDYAKWVKSSE